MKPVPKGDGIATNLRSLHVEACNAEVDSVHVGVGSTGPGEEAGVVAPAGNGPVPLF